MKKMTVLFEDEELYTAVKVEAARRNRPLKDLVTDILREWLEEQEDAELLPLIDEARKEYEEKGGRSWDEVEREIEEEISRREAEKVRGEGV